jgi:hypothetical protein
MQSCAAGNVQPASARLVAVQSINIEHEQQLASATAGHLREAGNGSTALVASRAASDTENIEDSYLWVKEYPLHHAKQRGGA